ALLNQMIVIEDDVARTKPEALQRRLEAHFSRHPAFDMEVTKADGSILMRSERILDRGLQPPLRPTTEVGGVFENIRTDRHGRFRMLSRPIASGGVPLRVQVATSLSQND